MSRDTYGIKRKREYGPRLYYVYIAYHRMFPRHVMAFIELSFRTRQTLFQPSHPPLSSCLILLLLLSSRFPFATTGTRYTLVPRRRVRRSKREWSTYRRLIRSSGCSGYYHQCERPFRHPPRKSRNCARGYV